MAAFKRVSPPASDVADDESDDNELYGYRGYGEPMNEKSASMGPAITAAIIVAVCDVGVKYMWDRATDASTATALAELRTNVANLSTQLTDLTRQPYVRREEYESRVSGLEQRVNYVEREQQQRGKR